MDFEDKVVLVTGASAGIGEAIAEEMARRGARLALVGRNEQNLKAVVQRCAAMHGKDVLPIIADLSTDEGCEKTAKETLDHLKRLDVLVNNVGIGCRTGIQGADMETFDRMIATNTRGVYNLTRLLVPSLIESKGNIVNISSISGHTVAVGSLPYGMAKAALEHFTQLTALELAPLGVRVNTVSPGLTVTTFQKRMMGYTEEEYMKWVRGVENSIPLGRACVGADIAKTVAHLANDATGGLITGVVIPIDGGLRFTAGGAGVMRSQMQNK